MKQIIGISDLFSMGKMDELREKVKGSKVAIPSKDIWKCLFAEFLGTFFLVLVGCGSATEFSESNKVSLVAVAACFAFMVSTLATTMGHISAHLNPAVTIAFFVTGKIQFVKTLLYVIVQCVAGIIAIAILQVLLQVPTSTTSYEFGYTKVADKLTPIQGAGIEFLITYVLVFVIFAVCDEKRSDHKGSGPVVIGLALMAIILFAGPLTGAGINPARVLGPCVILGKYENHWVYWLGPIGGGVGAGLIYEFLLATRHDEEIEPVNGGEIRGIRSEKSEGHERDNEMTPQV